MRGRPYEDTLTTIKGDPTSFSDAIKELLNVMQTDYEKREEDECKPLQLKLLAHDLLCGRIIGKAGNNLKKVRNDSGVTKLIISNSMYVAFTVFIFKPFTTCVLQGSFFGYHFVMVVSQNVVTFGHSRFVFLMQRLAEQGDTAKRCGDRKVNFRICGPLS